MQYGESDYDFIRRLLEEAGISFTFAEDAERGSVLVICDAPQANERRAGGPIPFFDNPASSHGAAFPHARAGRAGREARQGDASRRDFPAQPRLPALRREGPRGTRVEDALEQYRYAPGAFLVEVDKGAVNQAERRTERRWRRGAAR